MYYLKSVLLCLLICLLAGCPNRSWYEKQLDVDGPGFNEAKKVYKYTVGGVVFSLDVGVKFQEPDTPFCIKFGAISGLNENHDIKLNAVEILSSEGHQYQLISDEKLPQKLELKPMQDELPPTKSSCFFEFDGRLNPDFETGEKITITMSLDVDGIKGELTYTLVPVVKKFVMEDGANEKALNVRQVE